MTEAAVPDAIRERLVPFPRAHFLSATDLDPVSADALLSLADAFADHGREAHAEPLDLMRGRTVVNLFFENSTRTSSSFEIAAKRLGADVVTMPVQSSSVAKGEPDVLVVRHGASGAAELLSQKVGCAVVNAGDGRHQHPTQALLDALTLRRALGEIGGLTVAVCGDVAHSRVARSNVALLSMLGARVRLVGPPTLVPRAAERWGCEVFHSMREGLAGAEVVMMLRLQLERMEGALIPSTREYFRFWGLDREKLAWAAPGAKVMHPGPMNRGVEIDSDVADDRSISLIQDQVEMGVAARMAVLAALTERRRGAAA